MPNDADVVDEHLVRLEVALLLGLEDAALRKAHIHPTEYRCWRQLCLCA
jgi:hypothetical protein